MSSFIPTMFGGLGEVDMHMDNNPYNNDSTTGIGGTTPGANNMMTNNATSSPTAKMATGIITLLGKDMAVCETVHNEKDDEFGHTSLFGQTASEVKVYFPQGKLDHFVLKPGDQLAFELDEYQDPTRNVPESQVWALNPVSLEHKFSSDMKGHGAKRELIEQQVFPFPKHVGKLVRYSKEHTKQGGNIRGNFGNGFIEAKDAADCDIYIHHSIVLETIPMMTFVAFDVHYNAQNKPQASAPLWQLVEDLPSSKTVWEQQLQNNNKGGNNNINSGGLITAPSSAQKPALMQRSSSLQTATMTQNNKLDKNDQLNLLQNITSVLTNIVTGNQSTSDAGAALAQLGQTIQAPQTQRVGAGMGMMSNNVGTTTQRIQPPGGVNTAMLTSQNNKRDPNEKETFLNPARHIKDEAREYLEKNLDKTVLKDIHIGVIGDFTPDGDHTIIHAAECNVSTDRSQIPQNGMYFVPNYVLGKYELKRGTMIAFRIELSKEGHPLMQHADFVKFGTGFGIWELTTPFRAEQDVIFGDYFGKIVNMSTAGNAFVETNVLKKEYKNDAYIHDKIMELCHLGLNNVICFRVHISGSGNPQVSAPVWRLCIPGGHKGENDPALLFQQALAEKKTGPTVSAAAAQHQTTATIRSSSKLLIQQVSEEEKQHDDGENLWELRSLDEKHTMRDIAFHNFEYEGFVNNINKVGHGFARAPGYFVDEKNRNIFLHKDMVERGEMKPNMRFRFKLHFNKEGLPQASQPVWVCLTAEGAATGEQADGKGATASSTGGALNVVPVVGATAGTAIMAGRNGAIGGAPRLNLAATGGSVGGHQQPQQPQINNRNPLFGTSTAPNFNPSGGAAAGTTSKKLMPLPGRPPAMGQQQSQVTTKGNNNNFSTKGGGKGGKGKNKINEDYRMDSFLPKNLFGNSNQASRPTPY
ncbi:unnamed protein product [Amoebophrya sp. A120]|nr:unnamed protein product [Amoebophrya sp. A120]|eukprot:GSA120T00010043001.1